MTFIYNDGGRKAAGYKGKTGDCVVRAVAIATKQDYRTVYRDCARINEAEGGKRSGRNGINVYGEAFAEYMKRLGWIFVDARKGKSRMNCDQLSELACKEHRDFIAWVTPMGIRSHYVAVIDGVFNDTWDSSRLKRSYDSGPSSGPGRIKGYWRKIDD